MSFSSNVRDELGGIPIKPPCCRRAYLYGLLYGASVEEDTITATFPLTTGAIYDPAAHAQSLIRTLFSREAEITKLTRGAHRYAQVSFSFKKAAKHLAELAKLPEEEAAAETLADKLEWKCDGCALHFMRGLFVSGGTVNDPAKSYHMEIKLPSDGRVEPVRILLSEHGYEPGVTSRGGMSGLFFKSSGNIQEVLAHLGVMSGVFDFFNVQIERDIRNNENRATNCVTENINRSMQAGSRQTAAIGHMNDVGLLPSLPDDLRETARLRLQNPEATLVELADMHTPPITKSGVHHRLERIMGLYEKYQKSKSNH